MAWVGVLLGLALLPVAGAATEPESRWWESYRDPQLSALVATALDRNASLAEAVARRDEAAALWTEAKAARQPRLNATARGGRRAVASRTRTEGISEPHTELSLGVAAEYEIDLWGRVRNAVAAGRRDFAAGEFDLAAARLSIAADVVGAYVELARLEAEADLLARSRDAMQHRLRLLSARHAAGLESGVPIEQRRRELLTRELELAEARGTIATARRRLAVLTGGSPETLVALKVPALADLSLPEIPTGIPSSALARRPDVAASVARLEAGGFRTAEARRARWPTLTLTATPGVDGRRLDDLLSRNALGWAFGAAVDAVLLDGGRRRAKVAAAEAQERQLAARHRAVVLRSLEDAARAFSAADIAGEQRRLADSAVTSASSTLRLLQQQRLAGRVSQIDLLETELEMLEAMRQQARSHAAQLTAADDIARALGGFSG